MSSTVTTSTTEEARRWPAAVRIFLGWVLLLIALLLPNSPLLLPPVRRIVETNDVVGSVVIVIGSALTLALVVLGIALMMRYLDRRPLREAGWLWTRESAKLLGIGLIISVAIVVTTMAVLRLLGRAEVHEVPWDQLGTSAIVVSVFVTLARAFLLQGIPEELIFRGYVMQTLADRPKLALLVSTVFFGIIHLLSSGGQQNLTERFLYLSIAFGFGFLAGVLVLRLRSLWPAVGIHAGFHMGNFVLQFFGMGTSDVTAWVSVGAVFVVVGLILLRGHVWEPVRLER